MNSLIFVGGAHKSGTTLLVDIVNASPDTSSLKNTGVPMDEGQWLQDVLLKDVHLGELLFGLSGQAYLDETDCYRYPDAADRLLASWQPYWDLRQRYLIEKSPTNIVRTRFLQHLFPGSSFLMTIRDPRTSYIAARKTMPQIGPETYFRCWTRIYNAYHIDARHLSRTLLVPYEGLLREPQKHLLRVQRSTGISIAHLGNTVLSLSADRAYASIWEEQVGTQTKTRCNALLPDWCISNGYKYS